MKTVFLVTEGDFSDYTILAVCEDRQTAEEIAANNPRSEIEERILNTQQDKRLLWDVLYRKKKKGTEDYVAFLNTGYGLVDTALNNIGITYPPNPAIEYTIRLNVLAETEQAALKKASDIVAQYKYENNLI
jgi:hypothetical protein